MASGVSVADIVVQTFNDMKVRKAESVEDAKKRKKGVMFCLNKEMTQIVIDEERQILCGDIGTTVKDPLMDFFKLLPLKDCRYCLFDLSYRTKESVKEDLIFVFWAPDQAPLKNKMVYAASKEALRKVFTGIKHEFQLAGPEDIGSVWHFRELLKAPDVVSIEGHVLLPEA
ncbi:cofilin-2-like [Protopterus annectens]|uniref:cofilin-2-like n=1 Tax=Protopterus annectens TaxID=7888 RepID=UPI001CF9B566|nr:cofilin-2-like [Protopterus annectens]